jgi:hypothetical protein
MWIRKLGVATVVVGVALAVGVATPAAAYEDGRFAFAGMTPSGLQVVWFADDVPARGLVTISTLGLSRHHLHLTSCGALIRRQLRTDSVRNRFYGDPHGRRLEPATGRAA